MTTEGISRRHLMQRTVAATLSGALSAGLLSRSALGQGRAETLLMVWESGANSLDIHGVGTNRPAYGVAWNCYDRLITYGKKTQANGQVMYDYTKLEPELAQSWTTAPDGTSVTFRLRPDAKFHDGSPVTAQDVKWSLDRAVSVGGFPTFQMKAGSLEKPDQFVVIDDHTLQVKFLRKDRLTMPDLGVPVAIVINSKLAKAHATAEDPWAMQWLKTNEAGGGGYKVESWHPGQELVLARFDDWKSGPMPKIRKAILREVPSAGNRRALLERGDADISFDLPPKDFNELSKEGKLNVVGVPVENAIFYLGMNVKNPPFDNPKIRQAVAYAVPYQKIVDVAQYGRCIGMFGSKSAKATSASWPQPFPFTTDIAKAKRLMAEAGASAGFEVPLSLDLGRATISEPAAILVQESLAQIGIRTTIQKIPGANWRDALLKKNMPLYLNNFGGWLNYPEYFFFWCYHGQNAVFNTMSYQNPEMDKLIDAARFEMVPAKYKADVEEFVDLAIRDVPRIPLVQPFLDVAMQKNITGYQYWFHLQLDVRQLGKTA